MAKDKNEGKYDSLEFDWDPVKYAKDGKQAQAVIWSTNVINAAVDAIRKGLPLKANPFIGKNTLLLKPDLVFRKTDEEIEDAIKCMQDPVYFASKCHLMTPTGLRNVKLRNYQEEYLNHLKNNRFSILLSCRQAGKSVTTAIYCLWTVLFNIDKNALLLSKSGPAGVDLLKKIKDMYLHLPYYLKAGTMKWNQTEISFDNNSSISTEPFSPTAGLGKTINMLILDEFAWCPPNDVELFYNNIIPTVTTISNSNVAILSTQNGKNLFYNLWHGAETKKNIYAPFKVDWWQVPQYNVETGEWEKRTEEWKEMMIGVLGSEQAFYYQYGTQFLSSDKCLLSREIISKLRDNTYLFESIDKIKFPYAYFSLKKQFLCFDPQFDLTKLKTEYFIILCDLAEGGGNDYTVFNILMVVGKDKFKQVGYWRSNTVDLELAALELWVMYAQIFNSEKCIVSLEWNTYGALFYNYLVQYNDNEYKPEYAWRFLINRQGEFDITSIVHYKKGSQEEEIAGVNGKKFKNLIPGIRFNSSNKKTACALLKMIIEQEDFTTTDLVTISEFENFEDSNGNGSYEASFGHDDIVMTLCQIPMIKNTARYKSFIEEYEALHTIQNLLRQSDEISIPTAPNAIPSLIPEGLDIATFGQVNQYGMNMNMPPMGIYIPDPYNNQGYY